MTEARKGILFRSVIVALLVLGMPIPGARAEVVSSWRTGFVLGGLPPSSSGLLASWPVSLGGFVEGVHRLNERVEIAPRLSASWAWSGRYRGERPDLYSPPDISLFWRTGPVEDLRTLEGRVAIRGSGAGLGRAFFGLAAGFLLADVKPVSLTLMERGPRGDVREVKVITAEGTGKIVTRGELVMSVGAVIGSKSDRYDLGFEGSFIFTTDARYQRVELAYFWGFR